MANIKKIKLFILRIAFIAGLTAIMKAKGPSWYKYYAMKWLRHYLLGSGKPLEVPQELLQDAKSAFAEALDQGPVKDWYRNRKRTNIPVNKYCVSHSTMFAGSGFEGRPALFYVLGGFSFKASEFKKGPTGQYSKVFVSGTDEYDWHATPDDNGEKHYHCSSIGESKLVITLLKIGDRIFGEDYFFPEGGWPMGNPGISNKLWEEMEMVGAKPFQSHFEGWIDLALNRKATIDSPKNYRRPRSAKTSERRAYAQK